MARFLINREVVHQSCPFQRSLAVILVSDSMPGLKKWLRNLKISDAAKAMVMRFVVAFVLHSGRMSCLVVAGAIECEARNRAQPGRFLARTRWKQRDINRDLRKNILDMEGVGGLFVFAVDATMTSQTGKRTENTYSNGNRKRRPQKGRRYNKNKHVPKRCHCFTAGVLITPSGIRVPYCKPYYTRTYCERKGIPFRTSAEAAADMIEELPLPEDARVVVLGDTAYDAKVVRKACAARGYIWIVPVNSERVFAGPKGERPQVRSRLKDWSSWSLKTVRLAPNEGKYATYRRLSKSRVGPKVKKQTFYAHIETRKVHSVGEVQLVYSTKIAGLQTATSDDVKILMTNDLTLSLEDIIQLYSLRWQIELMFKEWKSRLGFHQYQLQDFKAVEGYLEMIMTAFLYLEWYRAQQLQRDDLSEESKTWWLHQRTHGICEAVRLASRQAELDYISERLKTRGGIAKLKRIIRNSFAPEYRACL